MVLYFRNVHLDLPKIFALFWTPVLSRHGEENLTSRKNHLVRLWPTSFIRANYVQTPNKTFPVRRWQLLLKNRSMINAPVYKGKYAIKRTCFLYSYVKKKAFVFSYSVEPLSDTYGLIPKAFTAPWLLSTVLNTHLTTAFIRQNGA